MKTWIKVVLWVVGLPIAGLALLMVVGAASKALDSQPSAESSKRKAIELCWQDAQRESLDAAAKRSVAQVCEKMERGEL